MSYATLTPTADGSLAFRSSYDPGLVAALKARIPYQERRWDAGNKCWLIAPGNERALADICDQHLGVTLTVPANAIAQSRSETRLLRVEYIGAPKERDDGTFSAFGYCNGDWSVIFPQDVLKSWFELGVGGERPTTPTAATTLYGILGVRRSAGERELKKAFRAMARRWHPDVNKDEDAPEMMKRINDAYQVLGDPKMRKKYDAGLALEASLSRGASAPRTPWGAQGLKGAGPLWRPPIRCGFILAEGTASLGRFLVEKIVQWEDIADAAGRILVTSWPMGANHFVEQWI